MTEKRNNRFIIGTAISIAAIATAIDHTRHKLPEPVQVEKTVQPGKPDSTKKGSDSNQAPAESSPCSLDSPCGMGVAPCSMD